MFPQFIYQLQLDFYCHSPSARDLSLPPHSTSTSGNCLTLATLLFVFTCLWKPSCLILQPCSFPANCRTRIHLPIFEIPGLRQKAGAAHELKPLSIPPVTSRNLRDPVFAPGSLGLTHNKLGGYRNSKTDICFGLIKAIGSSKNYKVQITDLQWWCSNQIKMQLCEWLVWHKLDILLKQWDSGANWSECPHVVLRSRLCQDHPDSQFCT